MVHNNSDIPQRIITIPCPKILSLTLVLRSEEGQIFIGEKHGHEEGFGRGDFVDASVYNADEAYCLTRYAGTFRNVALNWSR